MHLLAAATHDALDWSHTPVAVRGHWGIESLHWLRDSVHREDDSTARSRSGP